MRDAALFPSGLPRTGAMSGLTVLCESPTAAPRATSEPMATPVGAGLLHRKLSGPWCRAPALPPFPVGQCGGRLPGAAGGKARMKHNLTLVVLTPEQIGRAKKANGSRSRITHALICGPYGQMFGTERQCRKYFTLWDPDHRIEVAPGKFRAPYADLFDRAVTTTAYAVSDYRTTPDLATRLAVAAVGRAILASVARTAPGAQVTPFGEARRQVSGNPRRVRRPGTAARAPGPRTTHAGSATSRRCPETRSSAVVALPELRHEAPGIRRGAAALRRPPETADAAEADVVDDGV